MHAPNHDSSRQQRSADVSASHSRSASGRRIGMLAGVMLVAILPYVNTLSGDFVWDDRKLIADDPAITSWSHLPEILRNDFFARNEDDVSYGYYRPVTTVSYLVDYSIWGLRPMGYHLTNVLLHAACSVMVALILLRLECGLGTAAIAALLFAVHPIHTESVAWIAGRTDLLAFLFTAAALLLHPAVAPHPAQSRRRLRAALSVLAFAAALLAKEMSIVFIGWVALLHLIVRRDTWRVTTRAVAPYVGVLIGYLAWRFLVIRVGLPGAPPEHGLNSVVLSSGATLVRYLGWMLVPVRLNAYVQNPYVTSILDPRFLVSAALLFLLVVVLRWLSPSAHVRLFVGMLAVSFLPIVNLIRAAAPADMGNMMAERFCYFPSFPFLVVVAVAVSTALTRTVSVPLRSVVCIGVAGVAVVGAAQTIKRNRDWNDELHFLTTTLEQSPNATLLWGNLAGYHLRKRNLDAAAAAIEHAEALDPDSHAVLSSRALWYAVSGRFAEALPLQERVVRETAPGHTAALNNLAYLYRMTGQQDLAEAILEQLVQGRTRHGDPHLNLAEIFRARGQLEEARSEYRLALEGKQNDLRAAQSLAALDVETGRPEEAEAIYQRLLTVYPNDQRIVNNLALVRHGRGDTAGALDLLARSVQAQPGYVKGRLNYAQLLIDVGRTAEAMTQLEAAAHAGAGTEFASLATRQLAALRSTAAGAAGGDSSVGRRPAAGAHHRAAAAGDRAVPSAVVLITIDTLRADFVSFAGHQPQTTPFMDALARKAVVFTDAYAPSSWTVPSMASLFTSLAPSSHGVQTGAIRIGRVVGQRTLAASLTTLAETLKQAGYVTVGVPGNLHLASELGFSQGFDYYADAAFLQAPEVNSQTGLQLQRAFGPQWETAWNERPVFLWIHYFDPHEPYTPREPWISRYASDFESNSAAYPAGIVMRNLRQRYPEPDADLAAHIKPLYESEISYVDNYLHDLSERLGFDDDSVLLIVTADHGEEIVDHHSLGHGHTLYQELVHVPLFIRWPNGLPQGVRIDSPVSLLDIYPTLVDLLGLKAPPGLQGQSLSALLRGQGTPAQRRLCFELWDRPRRPGWQGLRDGNWKLIRAVNPNGRRLLFDLEKDPLEQHDVAAQQSAVTAQLDSELTTWLAGLPPPPADQTNVPLQAATQEQLRSLGYLQ